LLRIGALRSAIEDTGPLSTDPPVALTIAGSDSSGGAGIQADLKTFTRMGVYGASVITALTAQNTTGVTAIHVPPIDILLAQIEAVTTDLDIAATKTGMLPDAATVAAVARFAARSDAPLGTLVVDPVMVATIGDRLIDETAVEALLHDLIPLAGLITPNVTEAAILLQTAPAATLDEAREQAAALAARTGTAVLLKGGDRESVDAVDILSAGGRLVELAAPRIPTRNTHGTGCTLAAAITAGLARGNDLETAVRRAKSFLASAIRAAAGQQLGKGSGPVDHLAAQLPG
jgi:hydroxymethylpyrimidine/phosphomethylpyrimidine kinase